VLFNVSSLSNVYDGMDVALRVGLDGDRDSVRSAGIDEVSERDDALVEDTARLEYENPGEVGPLIP
jgi:hypothetical protein